MTEAPDQIFDLAGVDHKRVEKFKPKFLATGGINLVYTLEDHPNLVVKAAKRDIVVSVKNNLQAGKPIDTFPTDKKAAQEDVEKMQRTINQARACFGLHMPGETAHLLKVPVTRKIVDSLISARHKSHPEEAQYDPIDLERLDALWQNSVWARVIIQEKVEGLKNPNNVPIQGLYAEMTSNDIPFQLAYKIATNLYLFNPNPEKSALWEFFKLYPDLESVFEMADLYPRFKDKLRDFVSKAMQFTRDTDEILDLVGKENVVFMPKKGGHWDYKVIDALYPARVKLDEEFKGFNPRLLTRRNSSNTYILNAVNYVRIINGLAEIAGIPDRIKLFPEGSDYNPIVLLFRLRGEKAPGDKEAKETI